jgi:DNA-binding XRE family transcriptional regulator
MLAAMVGKQIRTARLAAGLSEAELARRAGVQRSQLRELENDGNVTTATLWKVVSQLPDLPVLVLSPEATTGMLDGPTVLQRSLEILAAANALVQLAGGTAAAQSRPPAEPPAGATRFEPEPTLDAKTMKLVREMDALIDGQPGKKDM